MDEIEICKLLLVENDKKLSDNNSALGLECIKEIKEHLNKVIELYKILCSINKE